MIIILVSIIPYKFSWRSEKMIFNEIAGNIKDIKSLEGLHVETIYIDNEDLSKRILRVISDHNREYGISLENGEKLQDGDILFKDDKGIIVVKVNSEDVIVIKPTNMTEMGIIAHALGNRHIQAQFKNGEMIVQYDRLVEDQLKNDNINYSRENLKLEKPFRHVEFSHTH